MSLKDSKLLSLKEIEGPMSPHDGYVKREMGRRKKALEYVEDVFDLAGYIGGRVECLEIGEDWAIRKEVFPGVDVLFVYNRADEEFPSNLRVLYSGERIKEVQGEDLVELAIACVNHMLRRVREACKGEKLPEICYRV